MKEKAKIAGWEHPAYRGDLEGLGLALANQKARIRYAPAEISEEEQGANGGEGSHCGFGNEL